MQHKTIIKGKGNRKTFGTIVKRSISFMLLFALVINLMPTIRVSAEDKVYDQDGYERVAVGGHQDYAPYYECELYVKCVEGPTEEKFEVCYDVIIEELIELSVEKGILKLVKGLSIAKKTAETLYKVIDGIITAEKLITGALSVLCMASDTTYMCRGYVNGVMVEETIYSVEHSRRMMVVSIGSSGIKTYYAEIPEVTKQVGISSDEEFMSYCIGTYHNMYHNNPSVGGGHTYDYECSTTCNQCGGGFRSRKHEYYRDYCFQDEHCIYCGKKGADGKSMHNMVSATCFEDEHCKDCKYKVPGSAAKWHADHLVPPTCTEVGYCKSCLLKYPPLGHLPIEAICSEPEKCERCNKVVREAKPHDFSEATCFSPEICKECNAIGKPKKEHSWGEWKVVIEPGCYNSGTKEKVCVYCKTAVRESIPQIDHIFKDATCTEAEICVNCGLVNKSAKGHSWGDWIIDETPTCVYEGARHRECRRCRSVKEERIDKLDHYYSAATCTSPKQCIRCGVKSGYSLGHLYSDATCTTPETCSRCGNTRGIPLGHSYSKATCTSPETCSRCGKTRNPALGHSFRDATCTAPQICSNCGKTQGKSNGHRYIGATCTAPETCSVCGYTRGSALGHNFSNPTCTSSSKCKRCGLISSGAIGHRFTEATCTSDSVCVNCGITGKRATGHNYSDATCTSPETCKKCGKTRGAALGHAFRPATCSAPSICGRCGKIEGTPKQHNFSAATCTSPSTCKECGKKQGSALGHDFRFGGNRGVCQRCGKVIRGAAPVLLD